MIPIFLNNFFCVACIIFSSTIFKESWSTTMKCALLFTFFCYFYQLLPPFSRPHTMMTASGPQRNRNVNKHTHCIVVDQDSLRVVIYSFLHFSVLSLVFDNFSRNVHMPPWSKMIIFNLKILFLFRF
jgi:hypothetical protein